MIVESPGRVVRTTDFRTKIDLVTLSYFFGSYSDDLSELLIGAYDNNIPIRIDNDFLNAEISITGFQHFNWGFDVEGEIKW